MNIQLKLGDITAEDVDAIVNAANGTLRGGGGVDGAIHRAAGPELVITCIELYPEGCPTGEARMTRGFRLKARHVIHTVGPVYKNGKSGEARLLAACHQNSLRLAAEYGLRTVAFPAISTGVYGYPKRDAARVAFDALRAGMTEHPQIREVRLVLFAQEDLEIYQAEFSRGS